MPAPRIPAARGYAIRGSEPSCLHPRRGLLSAEELEGWLERWQLQPGDWRGYLQAGAKNATIKPTGFADQPDYYNTGKMGDSYGDGFPIEVNEALLNRGREWFNINCAVCHGKAGLGNGVIKNFGLATIVNLQDDRIRAMPDGQIFSTLTNGKNTMGAYGPQIAVDDRWAIVAYVRALQKSQSMKLTDLSAEKQKELQSKQ